MEEELRERFFNSAQESPGGWLLRALSLRAAAARLDWQVLPPRDNEPVISLLAEYRMLLGLAFENLLKAIISLVRLDAGISPALPKECHIHALETLAGRPECLLLAFTSGELQLLAHPSPFIEWAGRYPIPKKPSQFLPIGSSNHEREAELRLWERLVPLLHETAWVMKGGPARLGGHKLHMKSRSKPGA